MFVELGSVPANEKCVSLSDPNYNVKALNECHAYKQQLIRMSLRWLADTYTLKRLPDGFQLSVQQSREYYEILCRYNDRDQISIDLAYYLENNPPEKWDTEAVKELGLKNKRHRSF